MTRKDKPIRWGILGTGWIAGDFASALATMPDAVIHAVGSRSKEHAEAFGQKFDIPNRYSGYRALLDDPDVEIVHIATPHPWHKEHALEALNAGKAVLCEKPFTINAGEAQELIDCARRNKRFLMEAMWGRFTPGQARVRELLKDQAIGEVLSCTASFGALKEYDPFNRFFNPQLGGGALLDVGIYPLSLMFLALGEPAYIQSTARIGSTGVDESMAAVFKYEHGQVGSISATIRTRTPREAWIMGTEGYIKVHSPLTAPPAVTLCRHDKNEQVFDTSYEGWGFVFEAAEAMHCLRQGLTESSLLPLDETLAVMQTMDTMRRQWGMVYPSEL